MGIVEKLFRDLARVVFSDYHSELCRAVAGCDTLLDVGCGVDSPVQFLPPKVRKTGVDIFQPAIDTSREKGIHQDYYNIDVLGLDKTFTSNSFDCVFASEIIEHLDKQDGFELLNQMEFVAKKRIVLTTPVGFLPQPAGENNPWQLHRSGWGVEEMRKRGYVVVGLHGAKFVWNIKFLWKKYDDAHFIVRLIRKLLVVLTQLYVRNKPEFAFEMLCIKTK